MMQTILFMVWVIVFVLLNIAAHAHKYHVMYKKGYWPKPKDKWGYIFWFRNLPHD